MVLRYDLGLENPHLRLRLYVIACVLAVASLSASEPDNFTRCRDGLVGCDVSLLSEEQVRVVEAFSLGRNFRACVEGGADCQLLKLTQRQVATLATLRDEKNAEYLAPILASARNFAACVHGETRCDPDRLTEKQVATLLQLLAEQRSISAPSTAPASSASVSSASDGRRNNFKKFGIGLLHVLGAVAKAYVEIESEKADVQPIIVSGGDTIVVGSGPAFAVTRPPVESRVAGKFEGWTGETIFKLTNGQIWQQSSYSYHYHYAYQPKVVIYKADRGYRMQVDGVTPTVEVIRLR